jgi:hypothetical protein
MKIRISLGLGLGLALVALSGCAPTVWVKPGATSAEFSMDDARCQLLAEGANPDLGAPTIYTGSVRGDVAANIGVGLLHGLAQGVAVSRTRDLCMQAGGYVAVAPGSDQTAALPIQAASAAPIARETQAAYPPTPTAGLAAASMSASPMPVAPVRSAPSPEGRVVLFPVMITNEYHPHWTVGGQ